MVRIELNCIHCGGTKQSPFCELAHEGGLSGQPRRVQEFAPGHVLFYQDSPAHAIFCIAAGRVKVFKALPNGDRQIIRILGPGDVIGYRAMLAEEPFAATAEALDRTTACVIERETFLSLLERSNRLKNILLKSLALDLRQSEDLLLSIACDSVEVRVAKTLINLLPGAPEDQGHPVIRGIPRQELALAVGITPETLSRSLRQFARRGIIGVSRVSITVLDINRLRQVTEL